MKKNNKKERVQNNSKQSFKPIKKLETLKRIRDNEEAGTLTFVSKTKRYSIFANFEYFQKSVKSIPISQEIFYKDDEKKIRRNLFEVLDIFEDLKHDYCADFYVIQ